MRKRDGRLAAAGLLILSACSTATETKTVNREVKVAVPVGCVVNRPQRPQRLLDLRNEAEWALLAPGAKAQAIRAQAGARMTYSDQLEAATAGCDDAGD